MSNTTSDKTVLNKEYITAGANIAGQTLVKADGSVPASKTNKAFGVVDYDSPSGDLVAVKTMGIVMVIAAGTVTAGNQVEIKTGTTSASVNGVQTTVTYAGVQNLGAGFGIGKAITSGTTGERVLIELSPVSLPNPITEHSGSTTVNASQTNYAGNLSTNNADSGTHKIFIDRACTLKNLVVMAIGAGDTTATVTVLTSDAAGNPSSASAVTCVVTCTGTAMTYNADLVNTVELVAGGWFEFKIVAGGNNVTLNARVELHFQ